MSKLVRDRIPEIIQREGKRPDIRFAERQPKGHPVPEYRGALLLKLQEEVDEFTDDQGIEELADVLEVVYSLAEDLGENITRVEAVRHGKEVARGGFDKGIILQ